MGNGHQPAQELKLLTGLRGIAAWWVVLYHIRGAMPWLPSSVQHGLSYGYLGVDFFFLLSGFVIWISAHRDFEASGWGAYAPFMWRRIARITPLYFLILGGAILLALALQSAGSADDRLFIWSDLPYHLAMIQAWGFIDPLHWNVPAWSISTEMAAYLVFPLLAWPTRLFGRNHWASALFFLLLCGAIHLYFSSHQLPNMGSDIWHAGLVRCLLLFTAGISIAHIWHHRRDGEMWAPTLAGVIAAIAATSWGLGSVSQTLAVPLLFGSILLLAAIAAKRWPTLTPHWLYYAGEISYSTYLAHYLGWHVYKLLFVSNAANVSPFGIAGYLALMLVASILLYRVVERPAQSWLRRRGPTFTSVANAAR